MNINMNKFDKNLPCNLEPFGYIEDTRTIIMKKAGDITVISFGAMNHYGHYAPEKGGVAVIQVKFNLFIAIKYIPWDAQKRREELLVRYQYLSSHNDIAPMDVKDYFANENDYILPAQKFRYKEEYLNEVAEHNKDRAKKLQEHLMNTQNIYKQSTKDNTRMDIKNSFKTRTAEELKKAERCRYNPKFAVDNSNETVNNTNEADSKKKANPPKKKTDSIDGEELIPLD